MSHVTIELSDKDAAVLASQAKAVHMAPERYLSEIVSRALELQQGKAADDLAKHLDAMGAQVEPGTTALEMEAALEEALAAVRPRRSWPG